MKSNSMGRMKIKENLKTGEGSLSSVPTPIFTSKYLLESIFRDLHDSKTFAPLQIRNLQFFRIRFFTFSTYNFESICLKIMKKRA